MSELVSNEEPTENKEGKSPGRRDGNSLVDGRTAQAPTSQRDVPQALGERDIFNLRILAMVDYLQSW